MVVAYLVVGTGVGGAAEVFLPNLGAPDWALATVLAVIVLGLPIAAVMSWVYDLTPDSGPAVRDVAAPASPLPPAEAAEPPSPKSIVVLPFANLSPDPGNEYFSDGVTEDILTYLARVEDLHVISRTSAMAYKGSTSTLREIAGELGVPLREASAARYIPDFYGQWGGETHPEAVSMDNLLGLLGGPDPAVLSELGCHPGYVDEQHATSYSVEREFELRTLCDPALRGALAGLGIELTSFHEYSTIVDAHRLKGWTS